MIKITKIDPSNYRNIKSINPNHLIFVTHPTCYHCKELKPTKDKFFKKIKKMYSGDMDILDIHGDIMSSMMNQLPELTRVEGYPTILATHHGKMSQEYEGDRSMDSLMKFLKDNFEIKKLKKTRITNKKGNKKKVAKRKETRNKKKISETF